MVKQVLHGSDRGVTLEGEIAVPLSSFGDEQLRTLRNLNADLVFLDLENDPVLGDQAGAVPGRRASGAAVHRRGAAAQPRAAHGGHAGRGLRLSARSRWTPRTLSAALDRVAQQGGLGLGRKARASRAGLRLLQRQGRIRLHHAWRPTSPSMLHRLTGKKTLLVDLDLELGEVALFLGVQPRFNFVDMVQNFHRMDAGLLAVLHRAARVRRRSCSRRRIHPERAEVVTADQIRRILHFLRQHYEYVMVDTSKSFSPATLAAFEQSDLVFVVTQRRPAVAAEHPARAADDEAGAGRGRGADPAGGEPLSSRDDAISLKDIERTLGVKVYWTLSNDYEAVIRSVNTGKPIVLERQLPVRQGPEGASARRSRGSSGPGPTARASAGSSAGSGQFRGKTPGRVSAMSDPDQNGGPTPCCRGRRRRRRPSGACRPRCRAAGPAAPAPARSEASSGRPCSSRSRAGFTAG